MKLYSLSMFLILCLIISKSTINAQIHDIKKNSNENKEKHSNSSNSDNDNNSGCLSGCASSLFSDLFSGCLGSISENKSNNNSVYNGENNTVYPLVPIDQNKFKDDSIKALQNQQNNHSLNDFSLDINANFASGFEYSTEKNYYYYNFLPGVRVNLAWFLIDFRYNMLSEYSKDLPDEFKTWDLLFLLNLRAGENAKIILGTGLHKEEYTKASFNEHFLGVKIGLNQKRDYLNINGRLAIDYTTKEYPFSEVAMNYNIRFMKLSNLDGYFSIGGTYQNYYSSTDIWALQAGITLNWHQ